MTKRLDTGGGEESPHLTSPPSLLIHKSKVFSQSWLVKYHLIRDTTWKKRTLQSKLREKFGYIVQNYLVES